MKNCMKRRYYPYPKQRRGAAVIICLVLIVFLATLSGVVIKTVLDDRREARTESIRRQVQLLLQDGLARAEMLRNASPAFSGDTIEIPSEPPAMAGLYVLTNVYDEDRKAFRIDVRFRDQAGNTIVARTLEPADPKP